MTTLEAKKESLKLFGKSGWAIRRSDPRDRRRRFTVGLGAQMLGFGEDWKAAFDDAARRIIEAAERMNAAKANPPEAKPNGG